MPLDKKSQAKKSLHKEPPLRNKVTGQAKRQQRELASQERHQQGANQVLPHLLEPGPPKGTRLVDRQESVSSAMKQ